MVNWHFSWILHFGLPFKLNLKGCKWVWRSKILLGLNLNMVYWDPVQNPRKFFIGGAQERKRCTFLGPKHKSTIWDRDTPHLHIKPNLYVCRRVQGSQIFKQSWIISIRSRVIVILLIWVSSALRGGTGGWGVSRVTNYSLYEFSSVQASRIFKPNWIILISSRVIEFW